ncbi:MAG: S8 family peptidase [Planctomycetales bacterium]|nr:S8 family peptidase [Planctomycetales bacterium]
MAIEKQAGDFDHIHFQREPNREPIRRKRKYFPSSPPRPKSRADHGRAVGKETTGALNSVRKYRESAGVDPNTLLVLEFESKDYSIRDQLEERFGAWVIDENYSEQDETETYRYIVQFPDSTSLARFESEMALYQQGFGDTAVLPPAMRRDFFDALQHVRAIGRKDREGARLKREGVPNTASFYIDVDFWHPGDAQAASTLLNDIRKVCVELGGRLTGSTRTSSLLLAKIESNKKLLGAILELDLVARVDLPPLLSESYSGIFRDPSLPDIGRIPDEFDGLACVIDSGVIAGHPMLMNWVIEERDFDTGENSVVDKNGHGTGIAGLITYGDIAVCIEEDQWIPRVRICNAKVFRHDAVFDCAVFPEENRVEQIVERAIRYFVEVRNCRVFNFSFGNEDEVYSSGRQFPLAEKLDELARELDIVIVVSAGNRSNLPMPNSARIATQFQRAVNKQLLSSEQRVCNPATAALAVTVGSIARSDAPKLNDRAIVPAAKACAPSPFTRTGPGLQIDSNKSGVKPDFTAFGGNWGMDTLAGGDPRWVKNLVFLGEPTIRPEQDGRFLGAQFGTSFAAPHVTHAAALFERSLEHSLGRAPSANLIRAMLGSAAAHPGCDEGWLGSEAERLRLIGNGIVDLEGGLWSHDPDSFLVADDSLEEDKLHFYRIRIPDEFVTPKGRRGITIALAFDPPVRSSRKEYLARTMRFELLHGLTADEIENFRAAYDGDNAPSLPQKNIIDLRPPSTWLHWSTLQVRTKSWSQKPSIKIPNGGSEPEVYVVVTCQHRFPTGLDLEQRYGLVVRFWHEGEHVQLYQKLRARVRTVTRIHLDA